MSCFVKIVCGYSLIDAPISHSYPVKGMNMQAIYGLEISAETASRV